MNGAILVKPTLPERSDDVSRRAGSAKRHDRKTGSGFCFPVSPSPVPDAFGLLGVATQRGRRVGFVECAVTDEENRLAAKASSTCMVLRGEKAAGR